LYTCSIAGVKNLAKQRLEMYGVQELDFVSNLEMPSDWDSVLIMMTVRLGRSLENPYDLTNRDPGK
jgi:hypothetical protein